MSKSLTRWRLVGAIPCQANVDLNGLFVSARYVPTLDRFMTLPELIKVGRLAEPLYVDSLVRGSERFPQDEPVGKLGGASVPFPRGDGQPKILRIAGQKADVSFRLKGSTGGERYGLRPAGETERRPFAVVVPLTGGFVPGVSPQLHRPETERRDEHPSSFGRLQGCFRSLPLLIRREGSGDADCQQQQIEPGADALGAAKLLPRETAPPDPSAKARRDSLSGGRRRSQGPDACQAAPCGARVP